MLHSINSEGGVSPLPDWHKLLSIMIGHIPCEECLFQFVPRQSSQEWVNNVTLDTPSPASEEDDDYTDPRTEMRLEWIRKSIVKSRMPRMLGAVHVKLKHRSPGHLMSYRMNYGSFCQMARVVEAVPHDWKEDPYSFWIVFNWKGIACERSRVPYFMQGRIPSDPAHLAELIRTGLRRPQLRKKLA